MIEKDECEFNTLRAYAARAQPARAAFNHWLSSRTHVGACPDFDLVEDRIAPGSVVPHDATSRSFPNRDHPYGVTACRDLCGRHVLVVNATKAVPAGAVSQEPVTSVDGSLSALADPDRTGRPGSPASGAGLAPSDWPAEMFAALEATVPHLPEDRPRYLMGVGKPDDLVGAVARGIDMFDCVLPTRSGRNGQAFTWEGTLNLRNARHADDPEPLDPACGCPACRGFSRAYLHHVVKAGEIIAAMLLTWHNLTFYQDLMAGLRAAVSDGELNRFAAGFRRRYGRYQERCGGPE